MYKNSINVYVYLVKQKVNIDSFSFSSNFCSLFPSELSSSTPVLAGHTLKEWDFREKYLNKLLQTPQVVSVFLQDRVSKRVNGFECRL